MTKRLTQIELAELLCSRQGNISRALATQKGPTYRAIRLLQVLEEELPADQFAAICARLRAEAVGD